MKTFFKLQAVLLVAGLSAGMTASAADSATNAPAKAASPRSDFTIPASAKEGRDPFFPESSRPFEVAVTTSHVVEITSLKVKGYTVVQGRPMVVINNHSFMVGDEGDVLTPGGRIHIRCLEIRPAMAIIEVGGQKHQLSF